MAARLICTQIIRIGADGRHKADNDHSKKGSDRHIWAAVSTRDPTSHQHQNICNKAGERTQVRQPTHHVRLNNTVQSAGCKALERTFERTATVLALLLGSQLSRLSRTQMALRAALRTCIGRFLGTSARLHVPGYLLM